MAKQCEKHSRIQALKNCGNNTSKNHSRILAFSHSSIKKRFMQTTNNIFLVRPANPGFNSETAESNAFQVAVEDQTEKIQEQVWKEFDNVQMTLKSKGINVMVFEDTKHPVKPDAIFPNNWVTFHSDGTVIFYPMLSLARRNERRLDIVDALKADFNIKEVIDLANYEKYDCFLEGTGSIIFDHINKIAYACLSPRTNKDLLNTVCKKINYEPVSFHAVDPQGKEIYHTNVMMAIGEKFVTVCLESITNDAERKMLKDSFAKSNHKIIDISFEQMNHFAGNMLELKTDEGKSILALSKSAFDILTVDQKTEMEKFTEFVLLDIKTIETIGGGSVRCMIAEIFSPQKS